MNLNKRMIIIVALTSVLSGTVTFSIIYKIFSKALEVQFRERIKITARHFAAGASIGIVFKDVNLIKKMATPILSDKGVDGIEVRNPKGEVVVFLGKRSKHSIEIPIKIGESEETILFNPEESSLLGKVILFYNRKEIQGLLRSILIKVLLLTGTIIAIFSLISYHLVAKSVLNPLTELLSAVREVQKGNLDINISGGDLPETKELARAFSNMLTSLKNHQKLLEETYKEMAQNRFFADVGRFSLSIAHEIKNPLGVIKGSIDILKKKEINEEMKEQALSFMEEETKRIDRLIRDFLRLSRPDKLNLKIVDMKELISSIAEKIHLQFPERFIKISCPDIKVETDPYLMERILNNLIQNSFEAEATEVMIEVRKNNGFLEIKVRDNGKGIREEEIEEIFKPFYTTKKGGTGLGLPVVLQSVYALGGNIKVKSQEELGTEFIITLPLRRIKHGKNSHSR